MTLDAIRDRLEKTLWNMDACATNTHQAMVARDGIYFLLAEIDDSQLTLPEAATYLGASVEWVRDRVSIGTLRTAEASPCGIAFRDLRAFKDKANAASEESP